MHLIVEPSSEKYRLSHQGAKDLEKYLRDAMNSTKFNINYVGSQVGDKYLLVYGTGEELPQALFELTKDFSEEHGLTFDEEINPSRYSAIPYYSYYIKERDQTKLAICPSC